MILNLAPKAIAKRDGRIDPVSSSSVLLSMATIINRLFLAVALASSSRSFAVEEPSDILAWLGLMSAKTKVKSRKWCCKGRARFIPKKCARAWSEIPAILPWTLRVPTI